MDRFLSFSVYIVYIWNKLLGKRGLRHHNQCLPFLAPRQIKNIA